MNFCYIDHDMLSFCNLGPYYCHFVSSKKYVYLLHLIIPGNHWMSEWQLFPVYFILITVLGPDVFVQLLNSVVIYENGGVVFDFGYVVA